MLQIGSTSIQKCNTFLEAPSIINENVRNVLFHWKKVWKKVFFHTLVDVFFLKILPPNIIIGWVFADANVVKLFFFTTCAKEGLERNFVTSKWAQKARMLDYTSVERLVRDKHSSLLGPFTSYEEKTVLWIQIRAIKLFIAVINSVP